MSSETPLKDTDSPPGDEPSGTTHFGFRTVGVDEKKGLVRRVFDSVAPRYDLMNDLMSMGVHRLWKNAFAAWADPRPGQRILDVAGGTGDIALRLLERAERRGGAADVVVCDINPAMMRAGRDRALDRGRLRGLSWVCGDAERLPVAESSVDLYTIAFGLRNVTRIDAALTEARRVLKPGGRFLCLEFSHVVLPVLDRLYERYSFTMLPLMGRVVARNADAYRYLAESIRRFPPQDALCARMAAAGLEQCTWRNLSGGIAAMHSGRRV